LRDASTGSGRELDEALHWLERAARQGHHRAQYALGVLYARGNGVTGDRIRAYGWLHAAAEAGFPAAATALERLAPTLSVAEVDQALAELRRRGITDASDS